MRSITYIFNKLFLNLTTHHAADALGYLHYLQRLTNVHLLHQLSDSDVPTRFKNSYLLRRALYTSYTKVLVFI